MHLNKHVHVWHGWWQMRRDALFQNLHETGFANVGKGANKLDYVLIHAMMTI